MGHEKGEVKMADYQQAGRRQATGVLPDSAMSNRE